MMSVASIHNVSSWSGEETTNITGRAFLNGVQPSSVPDSYNNASAGDDHFEGEELRRTPLRIAKGAIVQVCQ